nr:2-iminopropanoate deaminase (RIDA) [Polytomella parva]|mmetsp:Transcript_25784/g.47069  ORF Transcript_25784/g.47069 Transcript_25784/m.47069 type:complete len:129 (-) Transcript_25784:683-1069(-)|eukprot:CAMPEP_0175086150 /NCGR_PEP_ID=MMETSP0052_2-20121109/29076_1 /TAXON_ID=51329 ORGANISM="Polytomella parva, Strain SAG 63-3" /NCGR_SAMPLE_ID=MMETSP0052_2 /ASSEMBLY_ACC=CAM_ASM_000194 /LENGTH=128 /DNA_ID=CAMNT_0016358275 /DNA_START=85 /DNA_END=471 /DNA_ORIENTATION=-
MSVKKIISTENAPPAIGPYSQAVKVNNTLYISGQLGISPVTKAFVSAFVEEQAEQSIQNLKAILEAAGGSLKSVVKTTILLSDISDFPKVNAIYAKHFNEEPPARSTFAVKDLPLGGKVEIEAIAVIE